MRHALKILVVLSAAAPLLPAKPLRNDEKVEQPPQILLVSRKGGDADIYLMNIETKEMRNLTNDPSDDSYPAWSPNGRRIAFASDRDGTTNIFVMDADGKNVKQLTKGLERSRCPAWSPDGKKIAYGRKIIGDDGITESCAVFVMDIDGGNVKRLNDKDAWNPSWSADGMKILFASRRDGNGFRIYEMDTNGDNVNKLTDNPNFFGSVYPCYSPNGKKIMWTDGDENALEVYTADADGSNPKALTNDGGLATFASWSPDGKSIAYQHLPEFKTGPVYIMNVDGTNRRVLLPEEPNIKGARSAWRPR